MNKNIFYLKYKCDKKLIIYLEEPFKIKKHEIKSKNKNDSSIITKNFNKSKYNTNNNFYFNNNISNNNYKNEKL